jgi:hypothetical protein
VQEDSGCRIDVARFGDLEIVGSSAQREQPLYLWGTAEDDQSLSRQLGAVARGRNQAQAERVHERQVAEVKDQQHPGAEFGTAQDAFQVRYGRDVQFTRNVNAGAAETVVTHLADKPVQLWIDPPGTSNRDTRLLGE